MQRAGATTMVEYGPGKVLCGLARRIDRTLDALPVEDADTLAAALEATGGAQHA
jgi:[acyl-carrier-protein] S-malonyltransferase